MLRSRRFGLRLRLRRWVLSFSLLAPYSQRWVPPLGGLNSPALASPLFCDTQRWVLPLGGLNSPALASPLFRALGPRWPRRRVSPSSLGGVNSPALAILDRPRIPRRWVPPSLLGGVNSPALASPLLLGFRRSWSLIRSPSPSFRRGSISVRSYGLAGAEVGFNLPLPHSDNRRHQLPHICLNFVEISVTWRACILLLTV